MTAEMILTRVHEAFNNRDIDAFISCFAATYKSEQPVYPDRAFQGAEQVRKNWSSNFIEMPDFNASLVSKAVEGNTIWAEWDWKGTRQDQTKLHMRGVTIFETHEGKIVAAKLYMEPVKTETGGIEVAIKEVMHGKKST